MQCSTRSWVGFFAGRVRPKALFAGLAACSFALGAADAQTVAGASSEHGDSNASSAAPLEEILVTGTFIRQNPEDIASPVVSLDAATLQQIGISNLSQLTNYISANYGSVGGVNDLTKGGGQDDRNTRSANLRGLGPSSTLVLLNGHRVASQESDNTGNNYVNLSTLVPLIEISNVDTVLDGASALYGSDAIAGVMNFITDKHFEGFRSSAKYTAIKDSPGWDVEAEVGAGGERTHLVASIDFQSQQHIQNGDRSFLNFQNLSGGSQPGNFVLKGSPVAPGGGDVIIDNGVNGPIDYTALYNSTVASQTAAGKANPTFVSIADPYCTVKGTGGVFFGAKYPLGTCAFSYQAQNPLSPGFEQILTHALGTVDLTDKDHLFLETRMYYQDANSWRVPSYSQTNGGAIVPASAPYNPFGVPVTIGGFRALGNAGLPAAGIEGSYNIQEAKIYGAHVVAGAEGSITPSWTYSADIEFSRDTSEDEPNDTNIASFQNALNGFGGENCTITSTGPLAGQHPGVAPCYYFNPFGNGEQTNAAATLFNVRAPQFIQTIVTYEIAEGVISGHMLDNWLPGGPVGLAIGGQFRSESRDVTADALTESGGFGFNPKVQPGSGERHIGAGFVEVLLPLLKTLDFDGAVRYENYGPFNTTTHKAGFNWRALSDTVLGDLTFRASTSNSFRAPALAQSTGNAQTGGVAQTTDPLNPGLPVQFRSVYIVSNPDLKPETSTNYNVGTTWKPIRPLILTLDYWNYSFHNQIALQNAQATINAAPNGPAVIRDAEGNLLGVDVTYFNSGHTSTDGLDMTAKYFVELPGGNRLSLNEQLSRLLSYDIQAGPGQPTYNTVGRANLSVPGWPAPMWRSTLMLAWERSNMSAEISQRFTSGVGYDFGSPPPKPATAQIGSWSPIDWQLEYRFGKDNRFSVDIGMINALNRSPPFAPFEGYLPELSDALGRQSYIKFNASL